MSTTTLTSREFNQDVSKAKRATVAGPVFITDRGHTSHVLLTIEDYRKATGQYKSITELLSMPDAETIDFDPPPLRKKLFNPADLS